MNIARATCLGLLASLCMPAHALLISGRYTGQAAGNLFDGTFQGLEFNGPVSGLIRFDTEIPEDAFITRDDTGLSIFAGPRVDIGFQIPTAPFPIDISPDFPALSLITFFDDGVTQALTLRNTDICCSSSEFRLVSLTRNLFSGFDLATFNPTDIDLTRSTGSFSARFFGGFGVTLDAIAFDGLGGIAVPEPPSPALLLLGFAALLVAVRDRSHRPLNAR
jgi:hypothetical protein